MYHNREVVTVQKKLSSIKSTVFINNVSLCLTVIHITSGFRVYVTTESDRNIIYMLLLRK